MKSLGKIFLGVILLETIMLASVTAMLERSSILEGDSATLVFEAEGKDIAFPAIHEINGVKITGKSTTRSLVTVQGKLKKTLIRRYRFVPNKSMDIPAYKVKVDGKALMTKPLHLKVQKDIKDGREAFIFEQHVDKETVYVGEPVLLSYVFKQREDIQLSDANFHAPEFKNFWAKRTAQVPNTKEDGYVIYQINYVLYPQKEGELKIESARMDVGLLAKKRRDFFNFQQVRWKSVYSNPLEMVVKALPEGVDLYGDYSFEVAVDKNVTKANEPVNLTLTIHGEGNVDDIEEFSLDVPHATVYTDKAKRNSTLKNGKNQIVFKQKFAIVSDRNFTIPSMALTFFNGEKNVLPSREFHIEVKNSRPLKVASVLEKKEPSVKEVLREKVVYQTSKLLIMLTALLSFLLGALSMWLWNRRDKEPASKNKSTIETRIKAAKSDKALLAVLLPFVDKTPQIASVIEQLEANIYHGKKHTIDRKTLAKTFPSYLSREKEEDILKDV